VRFMYIQDVIIHVKWQVEDGRACEGEEGKTISQVGPRGGEERRHSACILSSRAMCSWIERLMKSVDRAI